MIGAQVPGQGRDDRVEVARDEDHALAGVRHLVWDMGYGLDPDDSDKMGWGIIIGSFALTVVSWLFGYFGGGL